MALTPRCAEILARLPNNLSLTAADLAAEHGLRNYTCHRALDELLWQGLVCVTKSKNGFLWRISVQGRKVREAFWVVAPNG